MLTIRYICENKPSKAIMHMVEGLKNAEKIPNFEIKMTTFGYYDYDNNVCFGCAATCSLMNIFNKTFTGYSINERENRAIYLGADYNEICIFETAIDKLRMGSPYTLFSYFDFNINNIRKNRTLILNLIESLPNLHSLYWSENIGRYVKLAEMLDEIGY